MFYPLIGFLFTRSAENFRMRKLLLFCVIEAVVTSSYKQECSSPENARYCENDCFIQTSQCLQECIDQVCINGCTREGLTCLDACPCHSECPNGCEDCENKACKLFYHFHPNLNTIIGVVDDSYQEVVKFLGIP